MSALLCAIDWSTYAIDTACIPIDTDHGDPDTPPVQFYTQPLLGSPRDPVARLRSVRLAVRQCIPPDVCLVYVEEPAGHAQIQLRPIYGAIIASVWPHCAVATLTAVEWRAQLGLGRISKQDAVHLATEWIGGYAVTTAAGGLSEHHADALLLALAAREITWRAAA